MKGHGHAYAVRIGDVIRVTERPRSPAGASIANERSGATRCETATVYLAGTMMLLGSVERRQPSLSDTLVQGAARSANFDLLSHYDHHEILADLHGS